MKSRMFLPIFMLLSSACINAADGAKALESAAQPAGRIARLRAALPACPLTDGQKDVAKKLAVGAAVAGAAHLALQRFPTCDVVASQAAQGTTRAFVSDTAAANIALALSNLLPAGISPTSIAAGLLAAHRAEALSALTAAKDFATDKQNIADAAFLAGAAGLYMAARDGSLKEAAVAAVVITAGLRGSIGQRLLTTPAAQPAPERSRSVVTTNDDVQLAALAAVQPTTPPAAPVNAAATTPSSDSK